jgi:hypothetical protein
VLREPLGVDVASQSIDATGDQHILDELPNDASVRLGPTGLGRFGGAVDHAVAGWVRPSSRLDVVPVFDSTIVLEAEDSERKPPAGRNFHEALEQRLRRMVELAPILTQSSGVIRHERSAKQIDRAEHQADDCGAGV